MRKFAHGRQFRARLVYLYGREVEKTMAEVDAAAVRGIVKQVEA